MPDSSSNALAMTACLSAEPAAKPSLVLDGRLRQPVSPTLVATYTFVNPVVAVLLGWAVLGERLGGTMIVDAFLVIGSVIGLLWPGQAAKQATSAPHGVHGMVRR
jgi:threonine/homoserine efflux transporter RhtA